MNVLSVFDGMSCGQIALNRANIPYENYFSSEIKPFAIKVTQQNYPQTIQLGDILKIDVSKLPIIDLFIGGSPCQDFSCANKEITGLKGLKSSLFYEYVRILNDIKKVNPNVKFLLENVQMKKEWENIISEYLGVTPTLINSELVSAQMRKRLYWTNIFEGPIPQPKNKNIELSDILDEGGYTNKKKAYCLLESESRLQSCNWKRFRRWRKKSFVNIVFTDKSLNLFKNRILSQTEMENLQTVPIGYTSIINRNEAASLLGDGWTVDVIAHILSGLK